VTDGLPVPTGYNSAKQTIRDFAPDGAIPVPIWDHGEPAPRVTVLIDTYNYAHFVGRAIESALQQEYAGPPIDVLVVDDGSTDDTSKLVRRFGPRVQYIRKDNGGQASAINMGFRAAEGDIVCLLDGDDYFYSGKVQLVADAFRRRSSVGLVYNEFDIVDSSGSSLGKTYPEPTWTGHRVPLSSVPSQLQSLILLGHPWTCITSAMSVRRSLVANLTVPEDVFTHSPDLFLGLVLPFLAEVAIIETPATAYVYHGENVGLFRSSAQNRTMYERQMGCIRQYVREQFGAHFVRYGGRSIYGPEEEPCGSTSRLREYIDEWQHIAAACVDPAIKRGSQMKLAADLLLPDVLYDALRHVKVKYRNCQNRQYRRRIADAGDKEVAI
jgi:glycosyltransferase involved in cell wall biosynthesis